MTTAVVNPSQQRTAVQRKAGGAPGRPTGPGGPRQGPGGRPAVVVPARYRDDRSSRTGWYALAAFFALISLGIGGFLLFNALSDNDDPGNARALDDYVGQELSVVTDSLNRLQRPYSLQEEDQANDFGPNIVTRTDPAAGVILGDDTVVAVYYNPDATTALVPDVSGRTLDEARSALRTAGFQVVSATTAPDATVAAGRVIRTDPPAGQDVNVQAEVKIVVSSGTAAASTEGSLTVPYLIQKTEERARSILADAGLDVVVVYYDGPDARDNDGLVMNVEPRYNAPVSAGDTITITVGRPSVAPPTNPPQTNPPQTNPPQTNPPQTNPPPTNPPPTNPPPTTRRHRPRPRPPPPRPPRPDHDRRLAVQRMTPGTPLWGTQTALAVDNFPIAHRPLDPRVAHALALVKRHAAAVNLRLGAGRLDAAMVDAIGSAARRVESGQLDEQFPIDVYQTGSGTSTNMNVNEVIATLASEQLGRAVHPNDHVNASQSSNDTVPAAIRLALLAELVGHTHPALERLGDALDRLAARTIDVVKAGRTHLMDATPVTIGQEADAWAGLVRRARLRSQADLASLGELPLGGSAVGTGINVPDGYAAGGGRVDRRRDRVAAAHDRQPDGPPGRPGRARRGLRRPARRRRGVDQGGQRHPPARQRPVDRAGRAAPARAAGRLVDHAGQGQPGAVRIGQPGGGAGDGQRRHRRVRGVAGHPRAEHLPAGDRRRRAGVGDAARQRRRRVRGEVRGRHRGRRGAARAYAERTSALATALNPLIGYERAAAIVHTALDSGRSIIDVVIDEGVLPADEARRVLDPLRAAGREPGEV